jgi:hypothetical protein
VSDGLLWSDTRCIAAPDGSGHEYGHASHRDEESLGAGGLWCMYLGVDQAAGSVAHMGTRACPAQHPVGDQLGDPTLSGRL